MSARYSEVGLQGKLTRSESRLCEAALEERRGDEATAISEAEQQAAGSGLLP